MRYLFLFALALMMGCASSDDVPQTKAHPAATTVSDIFEHSSGMPSREVKAAPTFFSQCNQKGWRPFVTKTEYSCTMNPWW